MKKTLIIALVTIFSPLTFYLSSLYACTNFIVGKKASADGSVICSYSADSYGMFQGLKHQPAAKHPKGTMRQVYDWDTNKYGGEIPEAEETYNVIGNINEWQVTIGETTFGGREEMVDTTGIIDYGSLIYITLQRAKTARQAIDIMTSLVEQYGYCSEGETFTICDPNEAWIMEMMGAWVPDSIKKGLKSSVKKQLGRTVWVALRIPDDMICGHANQSRITKFNMKDKSGDVRFSKNVVSYARLMGWFSGKDEDFSYNAAYAAPDFSGRRICDARVWSFFNRFADGMDRYIPWAEGRDANAEVLPLWVKPNKKLTVQDVETAMRDHFENTPFSLDKDMGGGIWEMPYRPTPLYFKVDGKDYFNERPVSTHCCATEAPRPYNTPGADELNFSMDNAYWVQNWVSNMVYPRYSMLFPSLKEVRDSLDNSYFRAQKEVEDKALTLDEAARTKYLTAYTAEQANQMLARWRQLATYLIVKYNDMTVKPEENGQFTRTKYGLGATVKRPGYSEKYAHDLIKQTGKKFEK